MLESDDYRATLLRRVTTVIRSPSPTPGIQTWFVVVATLLAVVIVLWVLVSR